MATETRMNSSVKSDAGNVVIDLPGIDGYLRMSPAAARDMAGRMLQHANRAEGKPPAHMFIIPVDAD
jgi:hypothetical protein